MVPRITTDPKIFGGKPIVRGMRISVEMILDLMGQGMSEEDILGEYPLLEKDDLTACLRYAKSVVACEETEIALVEPVQ